MKKIVAFSSTGWSAELETLLRRFHIPVNTSEIQNLESWKISWDFALVNSQQDGLRLIDKEGRKLVIDFDDDSAYHRKGIVKRTDPLLKALGLKQGREKVWDLSSGLGRDAIMMAACGLQVSSFERNPVLYILLQHAADHSEYIKNLRLRFHHQDAMDVIKNLPVPFPENGVLYFDPMFPIKKKSALPPQEMLVLRELVGEDADALNIIKKASEIPGVRLVVKRADNSPQLAGVSHSIMGKMVRFDVFTHI